ncbi:leucine-rich repeat-containing 31 [Labeo rohita]|uniref:Leucine-rich repeat-containing 31 n=1 Tax=Labeo rohita TaxID=84645 RepID=A0A498MCF7_LABRO|nr:leucine-rich repeat-containing 31 [Labeo rohita]RXN26552.1 leucine-rich repeat-containing 31 [Labeo rohita]
MNQFRRKASFTERKKPAVGRLFRPSESSDKKNVGIPEVKESDATDGKENNEPGKEISNTDDETGSVVGWGRVKQFVQKLGKTPHSQNLSLSHCDLTATDVVELGEALPMLSILEELDLSNNKLPIKEMENFTSSLGSTPQLKTLKLSMCGLTKDSLSILESACQSGVLSHLKQLDLSYNGSVGDGGWTSLFGKAAALKGLEELDVSLRPSASLSASPWLPALLEALPQLSSLTRLSLQHWALSSTERDKLEKILSKKNGILECDRLATPTPKAAG